MFRKLICYLTLFFSELHVSADRYLCGIVWKDRRSQHGRTLTNVTTVCSYFPRTLKPKDASSINGYLSTIFK